VPVAPVLPAPEPIKPVLPTPPPVGLTVPAVPAVGGSGEAPGTAADRAKPNPETFPIPTTTIPVHPATTPGDSTMTTIHSAAAAVLGSLLLVPASQARATPPLTPIVPVPAAVAGQGQPDLKTVSDKLDGIQDQLKKLNELLNGRRDDKGFRVESDPGLVEEVKRLKDRLSALEAEVNKMKTQTALRPATPIVDPRAGKGTVRVVNEYPVQISIVVNGTSYRVAPNKTQDIEVPAGEFTYQLLEAGAASTRSVIKEKETVTLRIK
jgi:hypothetical protein